MSGFALHGLDHISPSQINEFNTDPGHWVMSRLFKRKSPSGPSAERGKAVEDGIGAILMHGQDFEGAISEAELKFDKATATMPPSDKTAKERAGIRGMIEQGVSAFDGWGDMVPAPEGSWNGQHRVTLKCNLDDGSFIEIWGYLDFAFAGNRKKVIDLKTTFACPSTMSKPHQVQRCIYSLAAADGWEVDFLYVTPKKFAFLSDGDPASVLAGVKRTANVMNNLLKISRDPAEIAQYVSINPDSFYWNSPADKTARREIFGF